MTDPTIQKVHAREILDSRGRPTVEVEVTCAGGAWGRASVPSGASTGRHEAVELRDGESRHEGRGVRRAVANVLGPLQEVALGRSAVDQAGLDEALCRRDPSPGKRDLGANAVLGLSLATAHAGAAARALPLWRHLDPDGRAALPLPMVNLISGGLHAGGNLDFQDYLFLPVGATSYAEALEQTVAVYNALGRVLARQGFEGRLVGDEGGFGPRLGSNEQALELIVEAFEAVGLTPGRDAAIALDVAATHFHHEGRYHLRAEGGRALDAAGMVDRLCSWVDRYPVVSIEDALAEDDWAGWRVLTDRLGSRVQLVGDDFFVTNPDRVGRGIAAGTANAVLVKVNQVGTLSEALGVVELARAAGYRCVVSARSGETEDSTLADLAVATGAGQIKVGSVVRGERLAKYNQLTRIAEQLPRFAAWPAR